MLKPRVVEKHRLVQQSRKRNEPGLGARTMKFGDFLFPESREPGLDGTMIDDALAEARLCDELGMDAVWLAEHHFDGNCAYVDPLTFAAPPLASTARA